MTIALAHVGREPAVTVADVNLKLIWDVISAIRVGDKGYAFVVDGKGRLIAHPDLSLVLRDTDFSQLPQVRQALDATAARVKRTSRQHILNLNKCQNYFERAGMQGQNSGDPRRK